MRKLIESIESIAPLNHAYIKAAQHRLNQLTKPLGSLGRLEELACQYVAITENVTPRIRKKVLFVLAADHGVASEGVSAYPQKVTAQMVYNFLSGRAAINILSRHANAEVRVVDVGVKHQFDVISGPFNRKVRASTRNIAEGPALTRDETEQAVQVGIDLARTAQEDGADIIGTGEMGIANTTASSALLSALTGAEVESVTGPGTGLDETQRRHKIEVIKRAIRANRGSLNDPLSALSAVGGLELAGICGLVIGGARLRLPVVIDGFISSVAALVAIKINAIVRDYLFFSHRSREQGHDMLLKHLGVEPILDLRMCLGEGTGAALAINIVEAAVRLYSEMATFDRAGVSQKSPK